LLSTLKQDIDDPGSLDGRARLAKLASPLLQQIPGKVLQTLFWQALADDTKIEIEQLKSLAISEPKTAIAPQPPENILQQSQPQASFDPYEGQPYPEYDEYGHGDMENYQHDTPSAPVEAKEHPLIKQAIALILHAPHVIPSFGDMAFLQEFSGHYSQLLQRLSQVLTATPVQQTLDALSLLATDPDYQSYKQITESYNQTQGHLSQEQVANDCLSQLRLKAAKQMKSRVIKKSTTTGGFKQLPQEDQQLFKWASELLELDILNQKLIKVGGKVDLLSPQDQEKLRQLNGQSS